MALTLRQLHPLFAAEAFGVDFSAPDEAIPVADIVAAMARHGVVVFRNETPPRDEDHVRFSKLFGPIEPVKLIKVSGDQRKRLAFGELVDVGNLDPDGAILKPDARQTLFRKGDRLWHADMSFMDNRATYSLLAAHELPPRGGDTHFADTRIAWDRLSDAMKARIDGLIVEHSIWHSRRVAGFPEPTEEELASRPPVRHPLVHVHAPSGRKALYVSSHASHIVGWPVEEGRALLAELTAAATAPDRVYAHEWRMGDVVMWDNLATLHRATDFEEFTYRRDMRRTTCREWAPGAPAPQGRAA